MGAGALNRPVRRIVSGGQTGVDRAALDVALALAVPCGGWCPRGRRAEDGPIPARYPVRELATGAYAERTRANVRDSDATLVLNLGPLEGGTALTVQAARALGRPCRVVALEDAPDPAPTRAWIEAEAIAVLNVAGPRESKWPGVHARAADFLRRLLVALHSDCDPFSQPRSGQMQGAGEEE